jgi:hypothetical protein
VTLGIGPTSTPAPHSINSSHPIGPLVPFIKAAGEPRPHPAGASSQPGQQFDRSSQSLASLLFGKDVWRKSFFGSEAEPIGCHVAAWQRDSSFTSMQTPVSSESPAAINRLTKPMLGPAGFRLTVESVLVGDRSGSGGSKKGVRIPLTTEHD